MIYCMSLAIGQAKHAIGDSGAALLAILAFQNAGNDKIERANNLMEPSKLF